MEIVVSGIGMVSALGIGVDANIEAIREGRSGISTTPTILDTHNAMPVGELKLNNLQLHEIAGIDPQLHLSRTALLGIIATREAMADAHVGCANNRIALVSATSVGGMDLTEHFFADYMKDSTKGRLRDVRMHDCAASTEAIARHCDINEYRTTVSTACSSAANAIIFGAKLLKHGIADCVVAGGTDALSAFTLNGFKSLMILDESPCRPFDITRAGLNLGEGAGYVVLQRKTDVSEYYCRLSGYANANDAFHQTASSVNGEGAFLAMRQAIEMAKITSADIDYINAHGTGTQNNDLSESAAISRLFGSSVPPFSSTKSFMGHTLAAAGGVEAALTVKAVKEGYLYPNINFNIPTEEYGLIPVGTFSEHRQICHAVSNSFGFGGNCTTLVFSL